MSFTTIEAHRGAAGFAVYAGAKAALTNFSRTLAVELAPERIRVNVLAPDTTPSAGNTSAVPERTYAAISEADPHLIAGGVRELRADAGAADARRSRRRVFFLASDLSLFVTGTTLHVDGGTWAASGFQHWPDPYGWLPSVPASMFREQAFE